MMGLIQKAEKIISKKIRVAVYGLEFNESDLADIHYTQLIWVNNLN